MDSKKLIAVAIVAIVAIAAIATFMTFNDDEPSAEPVNACLMIGGNVNEDYTIDDKDVELMDDILAGELNAEDYYYADANDDGVVDSKDMDQLKDIIDGKATEMWVTHAKGVSKIEYPLDNVIPVNADMTLLMSNLGAYDRIAGYIASENPVEQSLLTENNVYCISTGRQIKAEQYEAIRQIGIDLYEKDEKIGAIMYYSSSSLGYERNFVEAGIPILHVYCTSPSSVADAYATIGFLLGGEYEKKGVDMCRYCTNVFDHIEATVGNKAKVDALAICMSFYICEDESNYSEIITAAGGNCTSQLKGTGSTAVKSADAITVYDSTTQKMFNFSTQDLVKLSDEEIVAMWDKAAILNSSAIWEEMVWVNCSMPVVARVAYVAEAMYPDLLNGYGDKVLNEFIDKYLPYLNEYNGGDFDVTGITTTCTYEDYKAAGGTL